MAGVTLRDVALTVGVSAKTVSNVVNETGWVSDEVRDRVKEAIRELGYRPNFAARQLRHGRTGLLALALPELREPYFAELAASFVGTAQKRGRTVLINQTGGDRDIERALIEGEGLPSIDALVLSPLALTADDLGARRSRTPLVLLGEQADALLDESIVHVGMPNVTASRAAVEHLIAQGRRRIAAIGIQNSGPNASSSLRVLGYREALAGAGIAVDPALLREVVHFSRAEGTRSVEEMLAARVEVDALFCFNDSLAFGALHALAVNGIRVPEDVAVVGFDDIDEGRYTVPTLTTVGPGPEVIADRVFDLIDRLEEQPIGRHVLPHELVIRESA
jgi:DNA-binding LacI/PurR family transcriptional regulator